jgi:hypothetical protein
MSKVINLARWRPSATIIDLLDQEVDRGNAMIGILIGLLEDEPNPILLGALQLAKDSVDRLTDIRDSIENERTATHIHPVQ